MGTFSWFKKSLKLTEADDITDKVNLFQILIRSNLLDDSFSLTEFQYLQKLMEEALAKELQISHIEKHLEIKRPW